MAWWTLTPGGVWYNNKAHRLIGCIGMAISTEDDGHGRKVCQAGETYRQGIYGRMAMSYDIYEYA